MFHRRGGLRRGNRGKADFPPAVLVNLENHVVVALILPAELISCGREQRLVQGKNRVLGEWQRSKVLVDYAERVPVARDFRFVMVERSGILPDNLGNPLVARDDSLNRVGAFDGLDPRNLFQLSEDFQMAFLAE